MRKMLIVIFVMGFFISGCQASDVNHGIIDTDDIEISENITGGEDKEDVTAEEETGSFLLSDLLVDGHEILEKCPFWNMNWETLKEEAGAIENTYSDSFPGTPDMLLTYSESEGITYITDDSYICAILLTSNLYGLHVGIRVGDVMTQDLIDRYHLKYYGKSSSEGNATFMTGTERKSSQKLDYDCVFSGTAFISQEESDSFMEKFLEDITVEETSFISKETGIAISFYVKEGIIAGICMEYIV